MSGMSNERMPWMPIRGLGNTYVCLQRNIQFISSLTPPIEQGLKYTISIAC